MVREHVLPGAMQGVDLGEDVLEVGPGYGATTDVLAELVPRLTAVEIDPELVAYLTDRFAAAESVTVLEGDGTALDFPDGRFSGAASFTMLHHVPTAAMQDRLLAEVARVLRPGAVLVAGDSLASDELASHHEGDTYNPVDPSGLEERLRGAGFADVEVRTNPFAWSAVARKAG
jgi:SAM-dependent methyltransferase